MSIRLNMQMPCKYLGLYVIHSLVAVAAGCAPTVEHYSLLHQHIQNENYTSAIEVIEAAKAEYPQRDAVIYYLEEGILLHLAGEYQASCKSLFKAEAIMEQLYTESISKNAASFLINDNTIPYRGEDFEQVMVNLFLALNFICLNMTEDALVEARKVDSKLNVINDRYADGEKNVYREDGFVRYLMGVMYEMAGETNDAFISYRKAERIYRQDYYPNYGVPMPAFLLEDLLTSAAALGFRREYAELKQRYPNTAHLSALQKNRLSELIVIHYNGIAAQKVEEFWLVPMPDGYIAKIAYPVFQRSDYQVEHAVVTVRHAVSDARYRFKTVLMEDISAIAEKNLADRILRIKAKAIARATAKYLATQTAADKTEEEEGEWAGMLVQVAGNIASYMTENADTRHWRLLPSEIRVGRMLLPPGAYSGKIDFVGSNGAVVLSRPLASMNLPGGRKRFLIQRSMH